MRFRRLVPIAALALLPVTAAAQNREHLQMNADLRMLQEQLGRMQLALNQIAEQARNTDARIDSVAAGNLKAFADQKIVIDQILATIGTMREKLDDNTTRVLTLTQENTQVREGLRRLADQINLLVNILQPPVNPDDPDAPAPAAGSALGEVTIPESPAEYLQAAKNHYFAGRYDLAVEGFREVVQLFPGTQQAADAQLHVGYALYQQGKYREAIPEFQAVITGFAETGDLAEAYLQQGLCYERLDQRTNARKMFQQVVDLFPDSPQAIMATQRMNRD